ncbi:MAG: cation diffusion facilitator family transporter [Gammaproteobacteria bacterium]
MNVTPHASLARFAWLSIGAALATITLKALAYYLTDSVGLLSDALESMVNLVAAVLALVVINVAERPPDEDHEYGHTKAEYFSSGAEGTLILVAALVIIATAVPRFIHPHPLTRIDTGIIVSLLASAVNFAVARLLIRIGRERHSIVLEADGAHLMTDVWTSLGVMIGVGLVALSGWLWLDPLIAILVAANIIYTGVHFLWRSIAGLMDAAIPREQRAAIEAILARYRQTDGVRFHTLRTRQSGSRGFVSFHILVPGTWTVQHGQELVERIEAEVHATVPNLHLLTHLESLDHPASWRDMGLDRKP